MRITCLYLKDYNRLALSGIREFEYRPTSAVQFIVGTNGSGKSSLLDVLSPLPLEKEDFGPHGYKAVDVIHGADAYHLVSDLSAIHQHSFVKNGEELNLAGKVTVQRELVETHLHYTTEIHQLAIGRVKFADLRPPERKYWFTKLADANYDYPIGVFNRLKGRHRDAQGALKIAKKRLVIETAKVMKKEEYETLSLERSGLYKAIQDLIEIRMPQMEPVDTIMNRSMNHLDAIEREVQMLKGIMGKLTDQYPLEEEAVVALRQKNQQDTLSLQTLSNALYQEYEKTAEMAKLWKDSKLQNIAELNARFTEGQQELKEIEEALHNQGVFCFLRREVDPEQLMRSIASCKIDLPALLDPLHDNRESGYTTEAYNTLSNQREETLAILQKAKVDMARIEEQGNYIHSHRHENDLECPKCAHRFHPIFDPKKLEVLAEHLKVVEETQRVATEKIKALTESMKVMDTYFHAYSEALAYFRNTPGLQGFAGYLMKSEVLKNTPNAVPDLLEHVYQRALLWQRQDTLERQLAEGVNLLAHIDGEKNVTVEAIDANLLKLEARVAEIEEQKRQLLREKASLEDHHEKIRKILQIRSFLEQSKATLDSLQADAIESARRQSFADFLTHLQVRAANLEQTLNVADRQQAVISDIEAQILQLAKEENEINLLLKALSPTEGLIAEGIFAFMQAFVEEMNNTIKLVWSYPLRVEPCKTDKEESVNLDYRFPLLVDTVRRSDVSMGSEGIVEMLNLAFRLAAMKALGLGTYPLFLDEFGRTLDQTHKEASIGLVNALVELDNFEQLFMVSHDVVQYGSLGTSQICMLHKSNVKLPTNCAYNKHVVIR